MASRSGAWAVITGSAPYRCFRITRASCTDVRELLSTARVRISPAARDDTSRILRTAPWQAIPTPGITSKRCRVNSKDGTIPISAAPDANCSAQPEGTLKSSSKIPFWGPCSIPHTNGVVFKKLTAQTRGLTVGVCWSNPQCNKPPVQAFSPGPGSTAHACMQPLVWYPFRERIRVAPSWWNLHDSKVHLCPYFGFCRRRYRVCADYSELGALAINRISRVKHHEHQPQFGGWPRILPAPRRGYRHLGFATHSLRQRHRKQPRAGVEERQQLPERPEGRSADRTARSPDDFRGRARNGLLHGPLPTDRHCRLQGRPVCCRQRQQPRAALPESVQSGHATAEAVSHAGLVDRPGHPGHAGCQLYRPGYTQRPRHLSDERLGRSPVLDRFRQPGEPLDDGRRQSARPAI